MNLTLVVIKKIFFFLKIDLVNFTDEEGYGKYLDLNEVYQKYINIKGVDVNNQEFYTKLD